MSWIPYLSMFLLMVVGLLMIFIILLQRGRGGGLAGALGGMGGTSAFGTRAGDVFTKITIGLAIVWTILAAVNVWVLGMNTTRFKGGTLAVPTAPALEAGPGAGATTGDESMPDGALPTEPGTEGQSGDAKPSTETNQDATRSPASTDAAQPADPDAKPDSPAKPETKPDNSEPN